MAIVLDASILLAWVFEDETSELAEAAIEGALKDGAIAPTMLWYEFANGIRSAARRQRLEPDAFDDVVQRVSGLEIESLGLSVEELVGEVIPLALSHDLSSYDASYLHLALRERLPLATLDSRLRAAAEAAGCKLFA